MIYGKTTYAEERARDLRATIELARAVAPLLPRGWRFEAPGEEHYWGTIVRDADGARINVQVGGFRNVGRATFRGCWPRYHDGTHYHHGKTVEITVSAKRAAEAIAKEVVRRFLPDYDAAFADALAYVRGSDGAAFEANLVAARIASVVGGTVDAVKMRNGDGAYVRQRLEPVHRLRVRPAYGSGLHSQDCRVDFEAHGLDPDVALEVLEIIRAAEERKERIDDVFASRARVDARELAPRDDDEYLLPEPKARTR
jgi:hypothetical protein